MIRQSAGEIDGCWTVCSTDDADGCRFKGCISEKDGTQECCENPDLRRSAQKHALGVCDEGAEVRGGSDAKEDQGWIDSVLDAHVEESQKTAFFHQSVAWQVHQKHTEGDGNEQVRFIFLINAKIEEKQRY